MGALWTLEDAASEELQGRDWYNKGRLLVARNLLYLNKAKGRATQPSSTVTLVSGMFDLGRGDLAESFRRPFDHYIERFSNFLRYKFPKIIYVQEEHYKHYLPYLEEPGVRDYPVHVVKMTLDDIRAFRYYDEIQKVRTKPGWAKQAGWLAESPQATMPLYNPMVMSKLLWTRDAARLNPHQTDSFLWIDGGHLCNDPKQITADNIDAFTSHFDKLLITYFEYEPWGEIHGFEEKAFRRYIDAPKDRILHVGRGGVFGGTKEYLEVASEAYMLALGETLSAGYMGTEENIFSILRYRFPELVSVYENGEGGNCAIFSEAIYGPPPPPLEEVVQTRGLDLRGLDCRGFGDDIRCSDPETKETCPDYVDPMWLSAAESQYACHLSNHYCTISCRGGDVFWHGHACPDNKACDPPHGYVPYTKFYEPLHPQEGHSHGLMLPPVNENQNENENEGDGFYYDGKLRILDWDYATIAKQRPPTKDEIAFTNQRKSQLKREVKELVKKKGFNLRGLDCEIKDGKEVCFLNHRLGRDQCPPDVNSAYLAAAPGQWACQDSNEHENYCVVVCQDGTPKAFWSAFNGPWCAENPEHCAPKPVPIPYDEFVLREWSAPKEEPATCDKLPMSTFANMKPFTVTVLCRGTEIDSLRIALQTWTQGFMQFVDEWIFFVNNYTADIEELLEPYTKAPYNAKVRWSSDNHGILEPIKWLIGNSTNEHVLFLEKDFRLVESLPCALEQMKTGLSLLTEDRADVVKFRSRYNGGKANWADILYRGKEETVFKQQPNLLCNFYHWVDNPEKVWPEHFHVCNKPGEPLMYCVDAEFCNWTNNPFFISKIWWIENYVKKHWEIQTPPEDFDLETWMNWDAGAWNHRGWTIAEGAGMFKHADVHKFGV